MKQRIIRTLSGNFRIFTAVLCFAAQGLWAANHVVQFGGGLGLRYSPSSFSATVGDTVKWQGDFAAHPLSSTSVPSGAQTWHVTSGTSFSYPITVAGSYAYHCDIHVSSGMTGSFTASESSVRFNGASLNPGRVREATLVAEKISGMVIAILTVQHAQRVSIQVFDLSGHLMATVLDRLVSAGTYSIPLDAVTPANGFYFIQLSGNDMQRTVTFFRSN
jgi:plastocyanin